MNKIHLQTAPVHLKGNIHDTIILTNIYHWRYCYYGFRFKKQICTRHGSE